MLNDKHKLINYKATGAIYAGMAYSTGAIYAGMTAPYAGAIYAGMAQ